MTLTFNPIVYGSLLAEVTPKAIESEAEYDRTLALVEQLTFTQTALHKLLTILVEAYEAQHYPISESSPSEILRHIMEASGTRQDDLVGIIGASDVVSEIVNGKRAIDRAQAEIFAEMFKVSPSLFI
jgi:HTH-type transcriptional regulator / antitoxin HigA